MSKKKDLCAEFETTEDGSKATIVVYSKEGKHLSFAELIAGVEQVLEALAESSGA